MFFVLSGYVIAHVTAGAHRSGGGYALDRLTRIGSVAVPALAFAVVITPLVGATEFYDSAVPATGLADLLRRTLTNLLFVAQCWGLQDSAPLNGPFWSLSYEAWYYAVFGAWRFGPARWRWPMASALLVIAGPRIAVMFPCWIMGVAVYWHGARLRLPSGVALAVFVATAAGCLLVIGSGVGVATRPWTLAVWPDTLGELGASSRLLGDTCLAALFALNIAAIMQLERFAAWVLWLRPAVRWAAGRTLSIYLFHLPVFALLWVGFGLRHWTAAPLTLAIVLLMAEATERRLPALRRAVEGLRRAGRRVTAL